MTFQLSVGGKKQEPKGESAKAPKKASRVAPQASAGQSTRRDGVGPSGETLADGTGELADQNSADKIRASEDQDREEGDILSQLKEKATLSSQGLQGSP